MDRSARSRRAGFAASTARIRSSYSLFVKDSYSLDRSQLWTLTILTHRRLRTDGNCVRGFCNSVICGHNLLSETLADRTLVSVRVAITLGRIRFSGTECGMEFCRAFASFLASRQFHLC